jgi:hypothetical protein
MREHVQHGGGPGGGGTIGQSSEELLAADTKRSYALIQAHPDNSGNITISLNKGADTVVDQGIILGPGDAYEINALNLYQGAITGIASAAGQTYSTQDGR